MGRAAGVYSARNARLRGCFLFGSWEYFGQSSSTSNNDIIHIDLDACQKYDQGLAHAASVQCPTLFILGERDIMTPPRSAQKLVDAVPTAKVCVLDGSGHSLMMERPNGVLDALISIV